MYILVMGLISKLATEVIECQAQRPLSTVSESSSRKA
jgi:hypothetical protein